MNSRASKASGRRFLLGILLPVIVALLATFSVVGGLIYFSTSQSDSQALGRERALAANLLDSQREIVRHQQADSVAWQDALEAVTGELDLEWIDEYLGSGLYESYGHEMAFLLDPRLEPVYAMIGGRAVEPAAYDRYRAIFRPFAERLREIDWQGALAAYTNGVSGLIPSVGDMMRLDGRPAYVSFMPIASDDGEADYAPGSEYIHVTVRAFDSKLAAELGRTLQLEDARFVEPDVLAAGETAIPVPDRAGKVITAFMWTPERPGAAILRATAPAIAAAMAVVSIVVTALMFGLHRSTAEIEAGRARAQHLAYHDSLTGLANRALFEERLLQAVGRTRKGTCRSALLLLDLDRFKQVNDTLGHQAGDELIRLVAARLSPLIGGSDTLARIGGDEFAIILADIETLSDLTGLSTRIIASIGEPFLVADSQAFVGVSIGIAIAPDVATEADDLTRKADIALYEAKGSGRNRYRIFETEMSRAVEHRQALEDELRIALDTGDGLEVAFRPLVRADDQSLLSVEAELSWNHPQLGATPAETFISVAETSGLTERLGAYALDAACRHCAGAPGLRVSTQVFPQQLRDAGFADKVLATLRRCGASPRALELEIPETALASGDPVIAGTLRRLREIGIHIAVSRFGAGLAPLRLLRQFDIDRVELDRSFTARRPESADPAAAAQAVIELARAFGVEVSADGIDTPAQRDFFIALGCTSLQGNLFTPEGQAALLRDAAESQESEPVLRLTATDRAS